MSPLLKSVNVYRVHLDHYCLNCNSLIDTVTKNQRFCSTKWGKDCSREFRSKVNKKLESLSSNKRAYVKWKMYNPIKYEQIKKDARNKWKSNNLELSNRLTNISVTRNRLIKRVIQLDLMPIIIRGKSI